MKDRKPTPAMLVMLRHLSQGRPWYGHLRGRSEHGGGEKTLKALAKRGYIDCVGRAQVTQLGTRMLNKYGPPTDFGTPTEKREGEPAQYDQGGGHFKLSITEVEMTIEEVDPRVAEEKRVKELLEHMREDGEFDRYFEIPGEDAKLLHAWLQGSINELASCLSIIRQVAADTFGKEMEPSEFAEASGYDH